MHTFFKQKILNPTNWLLLKLRIYLTSPRKIILGSSNIKFHGWICTDVDTLNITKPKHWTRLFGSKQLDALLSEHVFEHLTPHQTQIALKQAYKYLKPGGHLRIAVPDGYHSDQNYINYVKPAGSGAGADDHKQLLNIDSLTKLIVTAGFMAKPLEYFDKNHQFHHKPWRKSDGMIRRSFRHDKRNQDGKPHYTSLIIDAVKPK